MKTHDHAHLKAIQGRPAVSQPGYVPTVHQVCGRGRDNWGRGYVSVKSLESALRDGSLSKCQTGKAY